MRSGDLSFCLVTDSRFRPQSEFLPTVEAALSAGATMIQFREKSGNLSDRGIYTLGLELAALCRRFTVPLVVDDRLDLAMAIGADGLHVGQKDLPLSVARKLWPAGRIFGVSVASVAEMEQAGIDGADYLGIGAFPTTTKLDYSSVGSEMLSSMVRQSSLPVIAIGGVDASNAAELVRAGCSGVAVVSAVWKAPDPGAAAASVLAAVQAGREQRVNRTGRADE